MIRSAHFEGYRPEQTDVTRDVPKVKEFVLDNGNKIYIKADGPSSFFRINYDKGQVPAKLTGAYTSYYFAVRAMEQYLASVGRTIVSSNV